MGFQDLTPDTQAALKQLFAYARQVLKVEPKVTSTLRTCAEQNALYAQGRTQPGGIVTNAQGCVSWHVLGRAVDIVLTGSPASVYEALGVHWEKMGGYWGGRIAGLGDLGHFEWHPGHTIEEMCPYPTDCDRAVIRSRQLNLMPKGGGFGGGMSQGLVAGLVASAMVGAFLIYDRRR